MVEPTDVESQWYEALFEEDCLRVMRLLGEYPHLLWKGWDSEPLRLVEGSRRNYWMPRTKSEWKGRTALHVAARRGCVALVEQVLLLCQVNDMSQKVHDSVVIETDCGSTTEHIEFWLDFVMYPPDSSRKKKIAKADGHQVLIAPKPASEKLERSLSLFMPRSKHELDGRKLERALSMDHWKRDADDKNSKLERTERSVDHWKRDADDKNSKLERPDGSVFHSKSELEHRNLGKARSLAHSERELDDRRLGKCRSVTSWMAHSKSERNVDGRDFPERTGNSGSRAEDLLRQVDGEYELQALELAGLNGNLDVLTIILNASLPFEGLANDLKEFGVIANAGRHVNAMTWRKQKERKEEETKHREDLRKITRKIIPRFLWGTDPFFITVCLNEYEKHRDFNFLPLEEYLFHFFLIDFEQIAHEMGGKWEQMRYYARENALKTIIREMSDEVKQTSPSLWSFLWELRDAQGRCPLHVAMDEGTVWRLSSNMFKIHDTSGYSEESTEAKDAAIMKMITTCDGRGRTALHRIVAFGLDDSFRDFLNLWDDVSSLLQTGQWGSIADNFLGWDAVGWWRREMEMRGFKFFSDSFWFDELRPLHSAVICKKAGILRLIVTWILFDKSQCDKLLRTPFRCHAICEGRNLPVGIGCLELAVMVGEPIIVKIILAGLEGKQSLPFFFNPMLNRGNNHWPALHLAAGEGKYELLKLITAAIHNCDPFMEDCDGNSPLHHATKGFLVRLKIHKMVQYSNSQQFVVEHKDNEKDNQERNGRATLNNEDYIVERQGCINLLLQLGCDMFKHNQYNEFPDPGHGKNAKFLSWWYEKQTREFSMVQNTFGVAANAISIVAALIATASYVGPLQPPLNYSGDGKGVQLDIVWVKIFIVCDTMSFYLAIAAIICSFIPSLPMPQQSMKDELRRTRRMVTLAVAVLFPSIIFVLVAFASSSIAVIGADIRSWNHGGLTIATASVGGLICLVTIILFFIRLVGFVFYRHRLIKKVYNAASF